MSNPPQSVLRYIASVAVPVLILAPPLFFLARSFRERDAHTSEIPVLPTDLGAFLAQAPQDACQDAAQRGARASAAFFEQAERESDWPLQTPSVTSHVLLACGKDCVTPDGTPLVEFWFLGQLNPPGESLLHRGELLALSNELGLRGAKPILWNDENVSSVEEELLHVATAFAVPPDSAWDARELEKGTVYGWELQAFCGYLGPSGELPGGQPISGAALEVALVGANTKTEAGTHDLEGLAFCLAAFDDAPFWKTQDRSNYAGVSQVLEERLASDLSGLTPTGQAYSGDQSFDDCSERDPTCQAMSDLLKQAHLIEWAALTKPACSSEYQRALTRYAELTEGLEESWVAEEQQGWAGAMTLLSSTHAVHAGRRLAWAYAPS